MNNLELDQSDRIGPLEQMPPAKMRAAAVTVCDVACDATVVREVLEALDLMGPLQKAVA